MKYISVQTVVRVAGNIGAYHLKNLNVRIVYQKNLLITQLIMNPKISKFIKDHPDMTVVGLAWALYWRLILTFITIYFSVLLLILIVATIIGL